MKKKPKKLNKEEVNKVVRKLLKKGQNWSLDLILGIVIFMLILSIFYLLISKGNTSDVGIMKENAGRVMNFFDAGKSDSGNAILNGNTVNITALENLYNGGDYEQIKRDLGITGEFCIVLEDSNNRIIVIEGSSGEFYGFGGADLNISGCLCGLECT